MGHELCALRGPTGVFADHRAALVVEKRFRAFERDISGVQPNKLKFKFPDGRFDQSHWLKRIGSSRYELCMKTDRNVANWLERFHFFLSIKGSRGSAAAPQ